MLGLRYEIAADHVTLRRNVWLPVALLALVAPGGWCLVQAFTHKPFDSGLFALGFVGTLVGLYALVSTPWLTPGRITCTHDGIVWGGETYARPSILSVRGIATKLRAPPSGHYMSWSIVVTLATKRALVLPLGTRRVSASTEPLEALAQGMSVALG